MDKQEAIPLDAIESQVCCEYCKKQETPDCPVKTASPWSRWGNYCNMFQRKQSETAHD